jgi:hypothetical protein
MARKPAQENAIVDWDAEMAKQAEVAAATQRSSGGGGKFFSMQGGILSFDGNPLPGNQMAVVILADALENSYYEGAYDPSVPASPKCFAFAKVEGDLEPHEVVDKDPYFERQHDACGGCPQNEWGSAATGKGKACKNVQRLAMIPAGVYKGVGKGRQVTYELEMFDDADHFTKAETAYMKLPVMSVKNYASFVKQVAGELRRPPHGVFANVWVEPDPKSQFKVMFELLDVIPNELLAVLMPRHKREQDAIDFPYSPPQAPDTPVPAKANNKLRGKK